MKMTTRRLQKGMIAIFLISLLLSTSISSKGMAALLGGGGSSNTNKGLYLYESSSTLTDVIEYMGGKDDDINFLVSRLPRVVQFYSPLCGHCVNFKPKYLALVRDIQQAHPGVEFHAVSCLAHLSTCRKFKVQQTPTLLTFPGGSTEYTKLQVSQWNRASIENALHLEEDKKKTAVALAAAALPQQDHRRKLEEDNEDYQDEEEQDEDQEEDQEEEEEDQQEEDLEEDQQEEEEEDQQEEEDLDEVEEENDEQEEADEEVDQEEEEDVEQEAMDEENREENNAVDELEIEQDDDNPLDEPGPGDFDELPREQMEEEKDGNYNEEHQEEEEEKYKQDDDSAANHDTRQDSKKEEDPWFPEESENFQHQVVVRPRPGALTGRMHVQRGQWENPTVRNARKEALARYQGQKRMGFFRLRKPRDGFDQRLPPSEGATNTMKAHEANTRQYMERRNKILALIERKKGRAQRIMVQRKWDEMLQQRSMKGPDLKRKLPYQVVVSRPKLVEKLPLGRRVVKMGNEESLMLDVTLSFLTGLQHGLYRDSSTISSQQQLILKNWLHLLSISLPQEWGIHEAIDDLLLRLKHISSGKANLTRVLEKHFPSRRNWSPSCKLEGGFNCGFWKLLHTVTVGIAVHKGGLSLKKEGSLREDADVFSPASAADTIRDYIGQFFVCPACSKHFVEQYDDCDNQSRCDRLATNEHESSDLDWKELAKWMWEFHNSVSVRILHEKADSEHKKANGRGMLSVRAVGPGKASVYDEISVIWPNMESCLLCFDNLGDWNEDAVFLHLEHVYWPGAEPDPKMDRLLRLENELDPTGSGLTMVLVLFGLAFLIYMRQTISKENIQRALIVAKSVRTGAAVAPKRSD